MRKAVLQTHRHHCAGCSCRWAAEHRPCSGLLSSHRSGLWLHTGHRWEDDASHLSVRCRTYSGPDSYEKKETVIKGMSSIEIGSHAKKWQQQPFVYLTGKSTMSLILSLQIKLLKENRLSWMIRTLGKRHSNSCLEASRCCWHFGQYLKNRVFENSLYQVKQRHQVNSWFRRKKKWLPCFFRCQHLRFGEEVEALLQGEMSSSCRLTQRALVLLVLKLLGADQNILFKTLIVFPHQRQSSIFRKFCEQVF